MKTYKLLKFIEPETSIPVGDTFQAGELIRLDNGNTIPADWLIEHGYIEEVKERPTSWEELGDIKGFWVDCDGLVVNEEDETTSSKGSEILFKKAQQAEASIALAQITQLLDKYDIPEKTNDWYYLGGHHRNYQPHNRKGLLRFDTQEKLDHFYKHHSDLISKLAPFYIF